MIDWGQIIITLIVAGGSFGAAYMVFRKGSGENKNKAAEIKVALDKQIDERVQSQLKEAWAQIDAMKIQIGNLEEGRRQDKRTMSTLVEITEETVEHIEVLELMIPNPPGIPARPDWTARLNGLGLA